VRFSFWPSPTQPWDEVLHLARHVEAAGWDGVWYADHFMPAFGSPRTPWGESWTTLSALAAAVPRLRLGPLVMGNTYRHPAVLAKMAATLDQISGGRVVLGIGAGWQENEHQAYGIPFYDTKERLDRLEEACAILTSLFRDESTDFAGRYYRLEKAPLAPKPLQQPLPLLVGGGGEKVTLRIAARYAQEWNVWGDVATLRHKMAILDGHCRDIGRDPREIRRSAIALLYLSDDPKFIDEVRREVKMLPILAGNVEEVRATVVEYRQAGVDELVVPAVAFRRMASKLGAEEPQIPLLDRFFREVARAVR
jgi:F420-dependent oxidoreductase-like protein